MLIESQAPLQGKCWLEMSAGGSERTQHSMCQISQIIYLWVPRRSRSGRPAVAACFGRPQKLLLGQESYQIRLIGLSLQHLDLLDQEKFAASLQTVPLVVGKPALMCCLLVKRARLLVPAWSSSAIRSSGEGQYEGSQVKQVTAGQSFALLRCGHDAPIAVCTAQSSRYWLEMTLHLRTMPKLWAPKPSARHIASDLPSARHAQGRGPPCGCSCACSPLLTGNAPGRTLKGLFSLLGLLSQGLSCLPQASAGGRTRRHRLFYGSEAPIATACPAA